MIDSNRVKWKVQNKNAVSSKVESHDFLLLCRYFRRFYSLRLVLLSISDFIGVWRKRMFSIKNVFVNRQMKLKVSFVRS